MSTTRGRVLRSAAWPARERVVDYLHKGVYAFATGLIAEVWIRPELQSARGRVSH